MLYILLLAKAYGATPGEATYWAQVEVEAKKLLPMSLNSLVHVTGDTHLLIAELKMQMPRNERRATFKAAEFYFGVKQGGEFVFMDFDVAEELVDDLIDIGVKAVVKNF